jgi:hypothetical protein
MHTRRVFLAGALALSTFPLLGARKRKPAAACPSGQTVGQMMNLIIRDISHCTVGGMR